MVTCSSGITSAELRGPRKRLRIRPEIFDFKPDSGLKRSQAKPKIPGTVLTDRHNESKRFWTNFGDDPKL